MTFGEVDAEHVPSRRCICRVRALCFDLTAAGILVWNDHALRFWRGKPQVHGQVKQRTRATTLPQRSRTSAPPTTHQKTINEGPFQGRLEFSLSLLLAENQTNETARPSGLPHKPASWLSLGQFAQDVIEKIDSSGRIQTGCSCRKFVRGSAYAIESWLAILDEFRNWLLTAVSA